MGNPISGDVLAFAAALEKAVSAVIEEHVSRSEQEHTILQHIAPLSVRVYSQDGLFLQFYEEGVDIWPKGE